MSAGLKIFVRTEASTEVGTGHLMRCLALAEGFQEHGLWPVFVTRTEEPLYLEAMNRRGFTWIGFPGATRLNEEPEVLAALGSSDTAGLVVDCYGLPANYFARIRALHPDWALAYIDDWGQSFEGIDLVINQNIYANEGDWFGETRKQSLIVLAGTQFALLRSEFRKRASGHTNRQREVSKILITLGGNDLPNHTLRVLRTLDQFGIQKELHAVLGPGFRHQDEVAAFASSRPYIRIWSDVSDMYNLMKEMDLAISGAGSTLWELYYLGLPNILYVLADNQASVAKCAHGIGCSLSLGPIEDFDPHVLIEAVNRLIGSAQERVVMSKKARQAVDGLGVDRVTNVFLSVYRKKTNGVRTGV